MVANHAVAHVKAENIDGNGDSGVGGPLVFRAVAYHVVAVPAELTGLVAATLDSNALFYLSLVQNWLGEVELDDFTDAVGSALVEVHEGVYLVGG